MKMQRAQGGFTLIELIMVIVILGILAATALPKFIDLSSDAEDAALDGVVGAISSAAAINYAAVKVGNTEGYSFNAGTACTTVVPQIIEGGSVDGYSFSGSTPNCVIEQTSSSKTKSVRVPNTH